MSSEKNKCPLNYALYVLKGYIKTVENENNLLLEDSAREELLKALNIALKSSEKLLKLKNK